MDLSSHLNFSQQDLRNRSFASQDLSGANFRGADLRGCSFRKACLVGATFDGAIVGSTNRQYLIRFLVIIGVAVIEKEVIANLLFGALGKTWEDSVWPFIILLLILLAAIGVLSVPTYLPKPIARKLPIGWIVGMLNGAVLGFYYGGTFSDSHPVTALLGGVCGAALLGCLPLIKRLQSLIKIGITTAGAIATYGFGFYLGTWAIAALSTGRWLLMISLGGITIFYLWLTTRQIFQIFWWVRYAPGTFFRGANLSNTTFEGIQIYLTDLHKKQEDELSES
jgi:Pentapeptide repeats (8 copies)